MTETSYASPPPTPGRPATTSGGRTGCDKLLVGCGLGCGLLVITFGVLAVIASLWVSRPGTQHETTAVVSPEGVAVVKLRDVGEDPGTQEFLTHVLRTVNEASREAQRQDLPENLRWIADLQGADDSPAGINMLLPKDLTVSFEPRDPAELAALENPRPEDETAFVAAVNFRSFVRPIKAFLTWVMRQENPGSIRRHGAHDLLPVNDGDGNGWATFVDGTLLFSNSYAALEASLDRLDRGTVERGWSGEVPQGDWDFFGVTETGTDVLDVVFRKVRETNAEAEAATQPQSEPESKPESKSETGAPPIEVREPAELPTTESPPLAPPEATPQRLAFGVDLKSADALDAELLYTFESDADAAVYAVYLEEEMEQLRRLGEREGLTVATSVLQDAAEVRAALAVTGFETKVAQMADWLVTLEDEAEELAREVERRAREAEREAQRESERGAGGDAAGEAAEAAEADPSSPPN